MTEDNQFVFLQQQQWLPENTSYVCDNCNLPYSDHNFAGGSMVRNASGSYVCNCYSQKKKILPTKKEKVFVVESETSVMVINENHPLLGGEDAASNN